MNNVICVAVANK